MLRYTKYFPTYLAADAWLTRIADGGYMHSALTVLDSGETTVTLEGEFAQRALDAEQPIAEGGFRLREIPTYG